MANPTAKSYNGTAMSSGGGWINSTYDDLLAVWDAYNGTGTGTGTAAAGIWNTAAIWSQSVSTAGSHFVVNMGTGSVSSVSDTTAMYAVLKVV